MKALTGAVLASTLIPTVFAGPPTRRAPSPSPEPLHIPLVRRSNALTLDDFQVIADNMRMKWNYAPQGAATAKRANSANIQTTNQNSDASYFAPVTIGTP